MGDDQGSYDDDDDDNNGEEEEEAEVGEEEEEEEEEEDEEDENGQPTARTRSARRASAVARANNKILPIPPHTSFFVLSHSNR